MAAGSKRTDMRITYEKNGRVRQRLFKDVAETLTPAMAAEYANAAVREIEIF